MAFAAVRPDNSLGQLEEAEVIRSSHMEPGHVPNAREFDEHLHFYRNTIRFIAIFIAHVAVILALLAYFLI